MKFQHCLIVSIVLLIVVVAGVFAIGLDHRFGDQQKSDEVKIPMSTAFPTLSDKLRMTSTPPSQPNVNVMKNKLIATLFNKMKMEHKDDEEETTTNYVCQQIYFIPRSTVNLNKKNRIISIPQEIETIRPPGEQGAAIGATCIASLCGR